MSGDQQVSDPSEAERLSTLTAQERERLRRFKWRCLLQAEGFSSEQARHLVFLKYLYLHGRLREDTP
ncbi:MAG TPA: hypothetical protein VIN09_14905 [Chloroflexota bacterium]